MGHIITFSERLYRQIEQQATRLQRSVDEWVEETVKREITPDIVLEEDLPPWLKTELQAMQNLSDTALWAIARSTMLAAEREELADLNATAQQQDLTPGEAERQQVLLNSYNETLLRRAHAAVLLQSRGYDVSDPAALQVS